MLDNNGVLKIKSALLTSILFVCVGVVSAAHAEAQVIDLKQQEAELTLPVEIFAKVGLVEISKEDFDIAMQSAMRTKFYHGTVPEGQLAPLQREIGDKLIADVLLLDEARRRGIQVDKEELAQRLKEIEARNSSYPEWEANREKYIKKIEARLEAESLLKQLEEQVRNVVEPSVAQVEKFYKKNPEKFTEPEQVRISAILLRVDPSSPGERWAEAAEFAKSLVVRIKDGEEFADIAKELSDDRNSAEFGGDMGYLHQGMLPEEAQVVVDKMEVGALSDPIRLLQGVALIKLADRSKSELRVFESVQARATELLKQDLQEQTWLDLISRLKKDVTIVINDAHYLPLTDTNAIEGQSAEATNTPN